MQSNDASPPPRRSGAGHVLPILVFGALPVAGLLAELLTGALSLGGLPLFPTWWHVVGVVAAVGLNFLLHLGLWREPQHLVARAVAIAFVAGMAGLYALAEAPAIPVMLFLSFTGLGILAMAPYFACCGMLRLVPELLRSWRASGRAVGPLALVVALLVTTPTAAALWSSWRAHADLHALVQLAEAMRDPARDDEVERLAVALRSGDLAAQRAFCAFGVAARRGGVRFGLFDDDRPFPGDRNGRFPHLADGRPMWFERLFDRRELDMAAARLAFHRVHGVGWNDDDEPLERFGWRGGADNDWLSSRIEVRPEPDAALAQVDWLLEVTSHGRTLAEARFDLRLPPLAVATSLSSWIEGQERPAAFGGSSAVQAAYDAVVARKRDPALLQELAPGLLRLLLFPLGRDLPPMRVRVGFTVPLHVTGRGAALWLPQVVAHTCRYGRVAAHEVVVIGSGSPERRFVDDGELAAPLAMPRGGLVAQANDADGVVVQRLVPRPAAPAGGPFVVVLEASATVAAAGVRLPELLAAFPPDAELVLFVAHGAASRRFEGKAGSAQLAADAAGIACDGGVDARVALQAALDEAARRGVRTVHWLHGAAAALQLRAWPTFPDGVQVAAFALHPGRNAVREGLPRDAPVVDLPRAGALTQWRPALTEALAHGGAAGSFGDHDRVYERRAMLLPDVPVVTDHIARLWAAQTARARLAREPVEAAKLAARYRVVAAGVGAIVLESKAQYDAAGLDPGALVGREPAGPIGGAPTPELSTWLMLGSGLLALLWWQRRGRRPAGVAA